MSLLVDLDMDAETADDYITASGTVIHSEVQVAVKWEWLSLPAALLMLSLIFFISTALVNRTEKLAL